MNLNRFWWGLGWVLVLAALVICLVPSHDLPGNFKISDKLEHLIGHGVLALYFAGLVPRRSWWKIFVLLLLFGIGIECAQYLMQVGRDADVRDVIANGIGTLFGLLVARLGLSRWPELAARLLGQRRVAP